MFLEQAHIWAKPDTTRTGLKVGSGLGTSSTDARLRAAGGSASTIASSALA
jgi:hypothetical protein